MDEDLPAAAVGPLLRVDGHDDGLRTPGVAAPANEIRRLHRGRVDADLVGTGREQRPHVVLRADSASDGQRDEDRVGGARHHVEQCPAAFVGRRDVEEGDLVGPGQVVAPRALDGIAGVAKADEAHALDDPPVTYVQARDDALREHWQKKAYPCTPVLSRSRRARRPGLPGRATYRFGFTSFTSSASRSFSIDARLFSTASCTMACIVVLEPLSAS